MRAIISTSFGGPEVLEIAEVPLPEPFDNQVRVRVAGSTVNPIDLSTRAGRLVDAGLMGPTLPVGLGWDVAGTIDAVGPAVRRFAVGDRVVGLRDLITAGGAHADFVVLDETAVAPAPRTIDLVAAATLPLDGLTADRSLALCDLRRDEWLLVTGAAGGVGRFVLELAAIRGIRTVAAVRTPPRDDLPADHVVIDSDDMGRDVRALFPGGVDAVIDAAVLGIDAHVAVHDGGTFIALVRPFAPPPIRGTSVLVQEVAADGARLTELSALADAGHLTLRVAEALPFDRAREAHDLVERGGAGGRVVLVP
jgi:NADPH:quinone reductase-like Zn-dependent oxidoreductase